MNPRFRRSGARAVYANPDLPAGTVDRDAYVLCVLEQLYKALGEGRFRYLFPSLG
ncbi:hypothetical protein SB659_18380 [Arthrobacter sp. SIMBA_036]|uniref:hypothetical protein n=1 Tax=Arthrobacter sp. SIMBA_036 TaxID=3085778 RepID=UPI00397A4B92